MADGPDMQQAADPRRDGYHHGDLAQTLIAAVRAQIEADGPERVSVSKACRAAGVSTAAPYKHFSDKNEILRHVCRQGFAEMEEAMKVAGASVPEPGPARVAALGKSYITYALANPGLFHLMFTMKHEIYDPEDVETHAQAHECFENVIAEVAKAVNLPPEAEAAKRLSIMLWTFVHGVSTLKLGGNYDIAQVDVDTDRMVDLAAERLVQEATAARIA